MGRNKEAAPSQLLTAAPRWNQAPSFNKTIYQFSTLQLLQNATCSESQLVSFIVSERFDARTKHRPQPSISVQQSSAYLQAMQPATWLLIRQKSTCKWHENPKRIADELDSFGKPNTKLGCVWARMEFQILQ